MDQIQAGPKNLMEYWKSRHGQNAKVYLGVAGVVVAFGLFKALPLIIIGFTNLVVATSLAAAAVIALAGLGVLAYFLTRPALWQAITIRLNNLAQAQRKREIARDPIGSGQQALVAMARHAETVKAAQVKLWGAVKTSEKKIEKMQKEREERLLLYQQAVKEGQREEAGVHAKAAEIRGKAVQANMPGLERIRYMAQFMDKVGKNIGMKIQMFTDELDVLKADLEIKAAGKAAGDAAMKTMAGPEFALLRESIEATVSQISQFEAGIEQFMTDVVPSLKEDDLRNGMLTDQALKSAEAWLASQNAVPDRSSVIESGDARILLSAGPAQEFVPQQRTAIDARNAPDDFSQFFTK